MAHGRGCPIPEISERDAQSGADESRRSSSCSPPPLRLPRKKTQALSSAKSKWLGVALVIACPARVRCVHFLAKEREEKGVWG